MKLFRFYFRIYFFQKAPHQENAEKAPLTFSNFSSQNQTKTMFMLNRRLQAKCDKAKEEKFILSSESSQVFALPASGKSDEIYSIPLRNMMSNLLL